MKIVYDEVADDWGRNEARKSQDIGNGVDIFMCGKEGGERWKSWKQVSGC